MVGSRFGRGLVALGAIAGAGAGLALGATVIATGVPFTLFVPELLPLGGGLALRLDSLGAFFLVVIGVGALPAALYGVGYTAVYEDGRASLRLLGVMFNLFLLTMSLVTLADNVLTFLLMWEGMSLTSYFLVMTEAGEERTRNAGLWYIGMTHAGLRHATGGVPAAHGRRVRVRLPICGRSRPSLAPAVRNAIFLLAFLGFGSKAGIVPLHVWLPTRASRCAQPRLRADVRRDDQDGHVRTAARRARFAGRRSGVVGRPGAGRWRGLRIARRVVRADGARPQATAGLSFG